MMMHRYIVVVSINRCSVNDCKKPQVLSKYNPSLLRILFYCVSSCEPLRSFAPFGCASPIYFGLLFVMFMCLLLVLPSHLL